MSLRLESLRCYRNLHKSAARVTAECRMANLNGLTQYIHTRFFTLAEAHRRKFANTLLQIEDVARKLKRKYQEEEYGSELLEEEQYHYQEEQEEEEERELLNYNNNQEVGEIVTTNQTRETGKQRKQFKRLFKQRQRQSKALHLGRERLLHKYSVFISSQIDQTNNLAQCLTLASQRPDLLSLLQVLSAQVGSVAYQRTVESHFMPLLAFQAKREERNESTEEATSERQNRIMQQAILPYCERLLLLYRTAIGEHNVESSLVYLSPWQVTESIVGTRSNVTSHYVHHGKDHLVIEIDENFNKQVIYVCVNRSDNIAFGGYNWFQPIEHIEVQESDEVTRTTFHSEYLITATQLLDALQYETPLHPTRKTVLVGHGVGGAVSLIMGFLLMQRGFVINNVITFGAPKAIERTLERHIAMVNPLRVVLEGDPLVDLPVSSTENNLFVHVGEVLLLSPYTEQEKDSNITESEADHGSKVQQHNNKHVCNDQCQAQPSSYEETKFEEETNFEEKEEEKEEEEQHHYSEREKSFDDTDSESTITTTNDKYSCNDDTHAANVLFDMMNENATANLTEDTEKLEHNYKSYDGNDYYSTRENTCESEDQKSSHINNVSDSSTSRNHLEEEVENTLENSDSDKNIINHNDDSDDDDDDDDDDDGIVFDERVATNYKSKYLIEHYLEHLSNTNISLTYAEGDEIWDEGEANERRSKTH